MLLQVVFGVNTVTQYPSETLVFVQLQFNADAQAAGILLLGLYADITKLLLVFDNIKCFLFLFVHNREDFQKIVM